MYLRPSITVRTTKRVLRLNGESDKHDGSRHSVDVRFSQDDDPVQVATAFAAKLPARKTGALKISS